MIINNQSRRWLFFKNSTIFYLKLQVASAIAASNEWKIAVTKVKTTSVGAGFISIYCLVSLISLLYATAVRYLTQYSTEQLKSPHIMSDDWQRQLFIDVLIATCKYTTSQVTAISAFTPINTHTSVYLTLETIQENVLYIIQSCCIYNAEFGDLFVFHNQMIAVNKMSTGHVIYLES